MFLYYLMARHLNPDRSSVFRSWQAWVESFTEGSGAVQTHVYRPWKADDVPTSQRSALGDHAALITFQTYTDASRANRIFADRLRLNAADPSSKWAILGRLYKEISSTAAMATEDPHVPARARMLPSDHHIYEISRLVPSELVVPLVDWHKEHLQWHRQTYGANEGSLLSAAEVPDSPLTYPYNVLAIYWYRDGDDVNDMCSDLFARYQRGWPELARWEHGTLRDQSPFANG